MMASFDLITAPSGNAKLRKAEGTAYYNCGLSLAPAKTSGYNVCAASTPGCRAACLAHVGRVEIWRKIHAARVRKTRLFFEKRDEFKRLLLKDMEKVDKIAQKEGLKVAFRPNIISDIAWEAVFPSMFDRFPHWQFYTYTKRKRLVRRFVEGRLPKNYYVTYSATENDSEKDIADIVRAGCNVAIPFAGTLPKTYSGLPVINGDANDLRFLDPRGVIVGLVAKLPRAHAKRDSFLSNSKGFIR